MTEGEAAAREAIRDLVFSYCRGVDRRDYALVRSLYWDDAIDDHGTMFSGSPDDLVAWLPQMEAAFEATRHDITNSLIRCEGDIAQAEHYVLAYHRTHPPERRELVIGGRYLDQYQRRDGVWKFWRRALALDWVEDRAVNEAAWSSFAAGAAHGRADGDDVSYALLGLLGRQG